MNLESVNRTALLADGSTTEYAPLELFVSTQPQRQEIMDWCDKHEIVADLLWAGYTEDSHRSVWGIKNQQHRTMFALAWA